ncbi:hypothetical protein EDB80DRAFT_687507 [Ilyonectria destructans]|nr:hypothetical protein EDB80DRAFT_687507 [Ilyonectria destructans]
MSRDALSVVFAMCDGTVWLWKTDTGVCTRKFEWGSLDYISSLIISPDSSLVATDLSGYDDAHDAMTCLRLWRVDTGASVPLDTAQGKLSVSHPNVCAFSNDNSIIAAGYGKGTLGLWKLPELSLIRVLEVHEDAVSSIAFAQDDSLLASGKETLLIWRTSTGKRLKKFWGHETDYEDPCCQSLAFSSDSRFLVASYSGSRRGCLIEGGSVVIFRNVNTGQLVWKLEEGADSTSSIAFSRDDSLVALTFRKGKIVVLCRAGDGARIGRIDMGGGQLFRPFSRNGFVEGTNLFLNQESLGFTQFGGFGTSKDNCWITWNGANLLWLPPDYRPIRTASDGVTVALGCSSGRLVVLRFQKYH